MYVADKLMRTAGSRILIIARKRHAKSKKQESTVHLQCTEFIWVKTILFYKHKQLFHFLFCCVGLVILIRIKFRVRVMVRVRVKVRDRVKIRVRVTVRDNITAGGGDGGLVWNDDVCIRRGRNAHQLDSDILASAKLQLYPNSVHLLLYQLTS